MLFHGTRLHQRVYTNIYCVHFYIPINKIWSENFNDLHMHLEISPSVYTLLHKNIKIFVICELFDISQVLLRMYKKTTRHKKLKWKKYLRLLAYTKDNKNLYILDISINYGTWFILIPYKKVTVCEVSRIERRLKKKKKKMEKLIRMYTYVLLVLVWWFMSYNEFCVLRYLITFF